MDNLRKAKSSIVLSWMLVATGLVLSSCTRDSENDSTDHGKACYESFVSDLSILAGEEATNCGFFRVNDSSAAKRKVKRCARDVWSEGGPVYFGHQTRGDDSFFCVGTARDKNGGIWLIYYDSDTRGGSGGSPFLSVSECTGLKFSPGWIGEDSFFTFDECSQLSDLPEQITGLERRSDY
jgi:hypothetical protein